MAKSLRASSKVKARNARRYNPNTDYAVTQAARLNAISQRLAARVKGPSVTEETRQSSEENDEIDGDAESKGWCLCFDGRCGGQKVQEEARFQAAPEITIDVQLLGLVDAESIGLSHREPDQTTRASSVDWMFHLATDR
jgi:hypothetical protein